MPRTTDPAPLVTAAEISRLAGVTRATVSNWRRRHADFPQPAGGTDASPLYLLSTVEAWLAARGQLPAASPGDELRTQLRRHPGAGRILAPLTALVLAAVRMGAEAVGDMLLLRDASLPRQAWLAVSEHASDVPGMPTARAFGADDAPVLRALLSSTLEADAATAVEAIAERIGHDSGARGGAYTTPAPLASLMADLIMGSDGGPPRSVLDPACGSGRLLLAAAIGPPCGPGARRQTKAYGQDLMTQSAAIAAVRLGVLAPNTDTEVHDGDSLRHDAFAGLEVEAVVCNPPFGIRDWGHEELVYDERWAYGVPPRAEPELAWVQHCLAHLEPEGRAAVLLPPATAERNSGRRIRAELVRGGALRAVIALPSGTAPPFHVGLHVWVLQRPADERAASAPVLFVDTAPGGRGREADWSAVRETATRHWREFQDAPQNFAGEPGVARAVPAVDLLDETTDVTPARHVRVGTGDVAPEQLAIRARDVLAELSAAVGEFAALTTVGAWPPAGDEHRVWRTATVADLAGGGALSVHRGGTTKTATGREVSTTSPAAADAAVLTSADVTGHRPPSGVVDDERSGKSLEIQVCDVIMHEHLHPRTTVARVADERDEGALLGPSLWLIRPDPERLDPWFLAGFLAAEENVHGVATGSTILRVDARRLRVPLLPLREQREYGKAFRHLRDLRVTAARAAALADETAGQLEAGLTSGALLPPHSRAGDNR